MLWDAILSTYTFFLWRTEENYPLILIKYPHIEFVSLCFGLSLINKIDDNYFSESKFGVVGGLSSGVESAL